MKTTRERDTLVHFKGNTFIGQLIGNAIVSVGCIFASILALPTSVGAEPTDKLNIIMIISEDQGWRSAGCYGNPDARTPNMDKLAGEGMRFTHAFAASTLCSPSRAVIDTGLMPFRNGGDVFGGHVRPGTKSIAHYLKDLGYETANIGKFSKHPTSRFGYEVVKKKWNPADHDAGLIDLVDNFLQNRNTDRPLFLSINTADTHMPWIENERFDLDKLCLPPHLVDTRETRDALADYYTSIEMLDSNLGKFLNTLEKDGYLENTLLIYTSDHGPNFPFAKWCLYDEGIRVPFIVRWPGTVKPDTVTAAMISHADIVPTLVEAAGGAAPADLDGKSFLDVVKGNATEHREYVFANHTGNTRRYPKWKANWSPNRAIRSRTLMYLHNLNPDYPFTCHITGTTPNRQPSAYHPYWDSWVELAKTDPTAKTRVDAFLHRPEHELYDLTKDPFQKVNLAKHPDYAEQLKVLQAELTAWREKQGDDVPVYRDATYVAPKDRGFR